MINILIGIMLLFIIYYLVKSIKHKISYKNNKYHIEDNSPYDSSDYEMDNLQILNRIQGSFIGNEVNSLINDNNLHKQKIEIAKKVDDYNLLSGRDYEIIKNNCKIYDILYNEAVSGKYKNISIEEIKYLKNMKNLSKEDYNKYIFINS